jgi:uncharacterized membrane protein YeaQ/YmgE (transglycosylase-associated protein family)
VQAPGFGLLGNMGDILVGVVGAVMAALLLPILSLDLGRGVLPAIIEATLGAVFLLVFVRLIIKASGVGGRKKERRL